MICASCGADVGGNESRCEACQGAALLDGRYRLEAALAGGAVATTYRAVRIADAAQVCVKELRFGRMGSFSGEKLFRREAALLRQLAHPAIPAYVDDFAAGTGKNLALYLVQEYVAGPTLKDELREHRYREAEVLAIADELLVVLAYLQGLSPPVIHRDLKPANVIRRAADGRLVLVDFGSARDAIRERGGSTVTGTFGYMAPEQFRGEATPATDLYGLGALCLSLLAHREADDLVGDDHRLAWRRHVEVSAPTAELLDRLLEPDAARRVQNATEAAVLVDRARHGQQVPSGRAPRAPSRGLRVALAALALAATLGAIGALSLPGRVTHPPQRPRPVRRIVSTPLPGNVVPETAVQAGPAASAPAAGPVTQPAQTEASPSPTCDGAACEPVPRGLKGARFGMTLAEVHAALPERPVEMEPLVLPEPAAGQPASPRHLAPGQIAARRLRARTTVAGEGATCELIFAVSERLSKMVCAVELPPNATLRELWDVDHAVRKALRGRYGEEMRRIGDDETLRWRAQSRLHALARVPTPRHPAPAPQLRRPRYWMPPANEPPVKPEASELSRCEWWSDLARLELRAVYRLPPRLEVINTSSEHEALLRRFASEAWRAKDL